MSVKPIQILIEAKSSGDAEIDALNEKLNELGDQQKLIDGFVKVKKETEEAAEAFDAAQQQAQKLGRDLAATEEPTKKQAADFARARDAVNSAKDSYQELQLRLQGAREQLTAAGLSSTNLAKSQAELRTEAQAASKAVADRHQALEEGAKAEHEAAQQARAHADSIKRATEETKAALAAASSEIELQRQQLAAAKATEQARLQAAQAQGDEAAALRAGNALRNIEADQLALIARAKRAEAAAVQGAVDVRRQELAAMGPLTRAQADELRAAENHAKALRVEAAAADQAAQRSRELTAAHKSNADATDRLGQRAEGLSTMLRQMAGALAGAFTLREFVTAAAQMEQLRSGLTAVTQDATQAGKELEFVRTVANRIGADVSEVGKAFLGLAASTRGTAVEGEPTRRVFEAVAAAMGKAGKSSAETANALQALSQMASKGVVQSEELRGQLGEALPGALNATARGLGITTTELMKLVEEGKIAAEDLFPALAKGLDELYGGAQAAKTLSQELTGVSNAFTSLAQGIGEAGVSDAIKRVAQKAAADLTSIEVRAIETGKSLGVLAGSVAALDFSGAKQAFAEIEAEAADKLAKTALHNERLKKEIEATGSAAEKAALAQHQQAQTAKAAGEAAAQSADDWVRLNNGYSLVLESVREQITLADKQIAAVKARGNAAVAEAKLLGDEKELRRAVGKAAADEAAALADLANKRKIELETLEAQLKSLQEEAAAQGKLSAERAKQIAGLEQLIAKRRIEVDTTRAQAAAAQDHARAKGAEVQAAQAALSAAQAATIARVADARASASLLETQRDLAGQAEQLARLMGNESEARRFRIEQLQIDIKLTQAKAEVQRAEAEGAIAVANATQAELRAKNQLTSVKEAELQASIKLAEAKLKEADATAKSTKVTQQAIDNLRQFGNEMGKAGKKGSDSMKEAAAAVKGVGAAARQAAGEFDYLGQRIEYTSERARQLHQQGQMLAAALEEQNARTAAGSIMNRKDQMNPVDAVPSFESMEQAMAWMKEWERQYAAKNPFTTKSSGQLGSFQLQTVRAEWQAEIEAMRLRDAMKGNGNARESAQTPLESMRSGQTITINLQLDGQGFGQVNTDSAGAATLQALMRELERSKRNSGR